MPLQQVSVPYGPDRQRMLNVLAQRRYRQRKRERLQSLESRLDTRLGATNTTCASGGRIPLQRPEQPPRLSPGNPGTPNRPLYDLMPDIMIGVSSASYMHHDPPMPTCNPLEDPSSFVGDYVGVNTIVPDGSTSRSVTPTFDSQLSAELQDLEASQFTFLSEYTIDIPTLKTMNVSLRIAHMLGITDELLDLSVSRVLDMSKISVPWEDLPIDLRPTEAQLFLPHYPMIDVLPWPSLRTRLICLFSQPDQLRPPVARGAMAIRRLLYSIDDESEGLRVTSDMNGHGYEGRSWEIGQAIIKDWWWVLDPEIISNSNRLRYRRGAAKLQLPSP